MHFFSSFSNMLSKSGHAYHIVSAVYHCLCTVEKNETKDDIHLQVYHMDNIELAQKWQEKVIKQSLYGKKDQL